MAFTALATVLAVAGAVGLLLLMPTTWFTTVAGAQTMCVQPSWGADCITVTLPPGVDGWGIDTPGVILPGASGPYGPTPPSQLFGLPGFLVEIAGAALLAVAAYYRKSILLAGGGAFVAWLAWHHLDIAITVASDPMYATATSSTDLAQVAAAGTLCGAAFLVLAYAHAWVKNRKSGGGSLLGGSLVIGALAGAMRTMDAARSSADTAAQQAAHDAHDAQAASTPHN